MIQVNISSNAKETENVIVGLSKAIEEVDIPLKRAGIYMVGSIDRNFEAEGRPKRWIRLSPMTIEMRRHGEGRGTARILQDTGRLRASITYEIVGSDGIKIGTNIPYAGKLHFGGVNVIPAHTERIKSHYRKVDGKRYKVRTFKRRVKKKEFDLPSRPFILFQDEDLDVIRDIFVGYVQESIKVEVKKGKKGKL